MVKGRSALSTSLMIRTKNNVNPRQIGRKMKTCIGFGVMEGSCEKPVGSKWNSPYFCQECDEKRIDHITKGMNKLAEKFDLKPVQFPVRNEGKDE